MEFLFKLLLYPLYYACLASLVVVLLAVLAILTPFAVLSLVFGERYDKYTYYPQFVGYEGKDTRG